MGNGGFAVAHADITQGWQGQAASDVDGVGKGAQRTIAWRQHVPRLCPPYTRYSFAPGQSPKIELAFGSLIFVVLVVLIALVGFVVVSGSGSR